MHFILLFHIRRVKKISKNDLIWCTKIFHSSDNPTNWTSWMCKRSITMEKIKGKTFSTVLRNCREFLNNFKHNNNIIVSRNMENTKPFAKLQLTCIPTVYLSNTPNKITGNSDITNLNYWRRVYLCFHPRQSWLWCWYYKSRTASSMLE